MITANVEVDNNYKSNGNFVYQRLASVMDTKSVSPYPFGSSIYTYALSLLYNMAA